MFHIILIKSKLNNKFVEQFTDRMIKVQKNMEFSLFKKCYGYLLLY